MLNLKKLFKGYRDHARSMAELLPWGIMWDRESVATKDQGLLSVFTYEGVDAEGLPDAFIDNAVNMFENSFSNFGTGTCLWSFVDRRRTNDYPHGRHEHPISQKIEDVFADSVTARQFQNSYSLAVHQRSNTGSLAFFDDVDRLLKEEEAGMAKALFKALKARLNIRANKTLQVRTMSAARESLRARTGELDAGLEPLGIRQLEGQELLLYLHNRASPASADRELLPVPGCLAFLDQHLASNEVERLPHALKFTDGHRTKYVGVISLRGWPDGYSVPGMLDHLTSVDGEVTIAHTYRFLDRETAKGTIESQAKYHMAAGVPFFHKVYCAFAKEEPSKFDEGRMALAQDAREASAELTRENKLFGWHNLTVLCYGDSLEEMGYVRGEIMKRLDKSYFKGFVEGTHQLGAWMQTLPGHWQSSVRWTNSSFANAADLAPIRTLLAGSMECLHYSTQLGKGVQPAFASFLTDAGVPFNFDPYTSGAGHMAVVGPTRNGKSLLVNLLLSLHKKYPGARVVRFDKDYSGMVPTLMHDGIHVDLSNEPGTGSRMSPLGLIAKPKHHAFVVGWVKKMIETGRGGAILGPEEILHITQAIQALAGRDPSLHTLSALRAGLGPTLGKYLDQWTGQGHLGGWFDNPPDLIEIGDEVCIEMKKLFADKTVADLALDYLFYLVEQTLDGRPLIVNFEETWFFLDDERFVRKLDDFARTLGKKNGALWITTQGARELTASDRIVAMMQQFKNYIFLPDPMISQSASLYNKLGLTDEQISRIEHGQPKRDYYLKTVDVSRKLHIRVPSEVIPLLTADSRAVAAVRRHFDNRLQDPNWKQSYYDEMSPASPLRTAAGKASTMKAEDEHEYEDEVLA